MCIYQLQKDYKCYKKDEFVQFAAKRLTADSWSIISNDYYNRPLPERPYYYLHNVNLNTQLPTNQFNTELPGTTDSGLINDSNSEFPRTFKIGNLEISTTELVPGLRHANASKVRCEIRCGRSNTYILNKVLIDYIKAPQTVELTKSQLDLVEDTSQIMEFPDYVCQEIINELVLLVMTRDMDPRIQLQAQVTQSITNPIQQQTTQPQ